MARYVSDRERRLQRLLIPVNIIVCILALVAALSLLLTPIIKIDVGKILRDENTISTVEKKIEDTIGDDLEGTDQEGIDYKPVVAALVGNIMRKAEGEISITAMSSLHVITGSADKSKQVFDELLFGKNALATNLIGSVVDGVGNMFETEEGKVAIEGALVSAVASQTIKGIENESISKALDENMDEFVDIFRKLGDSEAADDNGAAVAEEFVSRLDEALGEDNSLSEQDKQKFIDQVTEIYSQTKSELKEGEEMSLEAILCVTVSKNTDLSGIDLGSLGGLLSNEKDEADVQFGVVEEEITPPSGDGENGDGDGAESGDDSESKEKTIVTNYSDLLYEIGFDEDAKEELKEKMRSTLDSELNRMIEEQGINNYLAYYQYVFFAVLLFMFPWVVLFLFAFFHMFSKNKRFMMWYVKLFCWICPFIWVALKLVPVLASKISFIGEFWNGENSALIHAVFNGISTSTWISGLCYVILWVVSILWAFPIKHKIRKELKSPTVEDDDYDDYDEE